MYMVRLLTIILIVLSTSLSATMATAHGPASDAAVETGKAAANIMEHAGCCEEGSDRASICHGMSALVPETPENELVPGRSLSIGFAAPIVLSGIEPDGPLDPPRVL